MRKLSTEERVVIAKIELDGFTNVKKPYQILVKRCKFIPDSTNKDEAGLSGYSFCYKIALINVETSIEEDVRFFTQCTESDIFVHVGNYMGTVYMANTFADEYYLNGFNSIDE